MKKKIPYKKGYIKIYYDAECYFCKNYTKLTKLKDVGKIVEIIDLRKAKDVLPWFKSNGYDVDEGMIVTIDEKIYFADKAINALTKISDEKVTFNKLTTLFFYNKKLSSAIYPFLVKARNVFLFLKNVKKIND